MDYEIRILGKSSVIRSIPSVVAVLPIPKTGLESTGLPEANTNHFGKDVFAEHADSPAVSGELSELRKRLSRKRRWMFVEPKPAVRKAADQYGSTKKSVAVRNIFEGKNGMLIGTDRVTLQMADDMSPEEAEKAVGEDGLHIVTKLGFAKNLYEARVATAVGPLMELVQKLQQRTHKYKFIEPVFIESLGKREAPTSADFQLQWHHFSDGAGGDADIDSQAAWAVTRGAGVRIAVIDTGMSVLDPSFAGAMIPGGYFVSEASGATSFQKLDPGSSGFPESAHGTFCLAMAGGRANGRGPCGSAPESDLMPIACTGKGLGTQLALARAVGFASKPSLEPDTAG
jgi:hypothetical protein